MDSLTPITKLYLRSKNVMERIYYLLNGIHSGVWLALLDRKKFHQLDKYYYNTWSMYSSQDHNVRGFFEWELPLVETYFKKCKDVCTL